MVARRLVNPKNNPGEYYTARLEAESALLGALIVEGTRLAVTHAQNLINYADFVDVDTRHARIWTAMTKCEHPDQISIALKMQELGTLRAGDCAYLCHLVAECPCSLDYLYYAKAVRRYARGNEAVGRAKGIVA